MLDGCRNLKPGVSLLTNFVWTQSRLSWSNLNWLLVSGLVSPVILITVLFPSSVSILTPRVRVSGVSNVRWRHVPTRAQWSCTRVTLENKMALVRSCKTHQLLSHPLGALGQKFEIWVCVNIEDVYQLGLEEGPNIDPLLMNLLNSIKKFNVQSCWVFLYVLVYSNESLKIHLHRSSINNEFE